MSVVKYRTVGVGEASTDEQYIRLQMASVPGLKPPKVVRTQDIFCAEGHILLPTQHVHTLALSFIIGATQSGCDSRAHPCTMTLGGEVEQGRVNDAARVGQSTDLVVASLFLLCFFVSLSCTSCGFLSFETVFSLVFLRFLLLRLLWVSSVFWELTISALFRYIFLHISLKVTLFI